MCWFWRRATKRRKLSVQLATLQRWSRMQRSSLWSCQRPLWPPQCPALRTSCALSRYVDLFLCSSFQIFSGRLCCPDPVRGNTTLQYVCRIDPLLNSTACCAIGIPSAESYCGCADHCVVHQGHSERHIRDGEPDSDAGRSRAAAQAPGLSQWTQLCCRGMALLPFCPSTSWDT